MNALKQVEQITYLHFTQKVDQEDRLKLFELGLHDESNNNCFAQDKPTEKQIAEAAEILARYYGKLTAYKLWWCAPINSWRIIFGNSQNSNQ